MADKNIKFIRKNGRIIPIKLNGANESQKFKKSNHTDQPNISKKEYLKASSDIMKKHGKDRTMSSRISSGFFGAGIGAGIGIAAGAGLSILAAKTGIGSKHTGKIMVGSALAGAGFMGKVMSSKGKVIESKKYDKLLTNKLNKIRKSKIQKGSSV